MVHPGQGFGMQRNRGNRDRPDKEVDRDYAVGDGGFRREMK
jgi:hypothetical protein